MSGEARQESHCGLVIKTRTESLEGRHCHLRLDTRHRRFTVSEQHPRQVQPDRCGFMRRGHLLPLAK